MHTSGLFNVHPCSGFVHLVRHEAYISTDFQVVRPYELAVCQQTVGNGESRARKEARLSV